MPNSRSTQIFINCVDNAQLDKQGFTPFGIALSGMSAIDSLYSGYGEEPASSQERIQTEGDAYLNTAFPRLDSIKKAILLPAKPDLPKPADDEKKPSEPTPSEPKPSASPPAPAKKSAG
jgi:cyclophilin family peptidyl-prolyl cis-trans isomerase